MKPLSYKNLLILLFLILLAVFVVGQVSDISFVPPTPADGAIIDDTSVVINVSITVPDLSSFNWNWNGTNYSFYDQDLILMYNFDNVSSLGENDTYVVDQSLYGNNGTVYNGTQVCGQQLDCPLLTSGIYNSAYSFDGADDIINIPYVSVVKFDNTLNYTFSAWVKPISIPDDSSVLTLGNWGGSGIVFGVQSSRGVMIENMLDHTIYRTSKALSLNQWSYIACTYQGIPTNTIQCYINGTLGDVGGDNFNWSNVVTNSFSTRTIGGVGYLNFNGNIDEVRMYNRTLSANEIQQQYFSNLYKYDVSSWAFYTNQSNLSLGSYTYFSSAVDSAGIENMSATQNLTLMDFSNVTAIFNQDIGVIRSDFYGANTHANFLSKGILIDANNDGTTETGANFTWHRDTWLNAKMDNQRGDMSLSTYYNFVNNMNFERWDNTSRGNYTLYGDSGALGWSASIGDYNVSSVEQSIDCLSGSYCINVTGYDTNGAFLYRDFYLESNHNYTYSIWVKGTGVANLWFQPMDTWEFCAGETSQEFTATPTWQLITVNCNVTTAVSQGYRLPHDGIGMGESMLFDNATLYEDGIPITFLNKVSLENITDLVEWAYNNNQKVYFIADRPPSTIMGSNCVSNPIGFCNGTVDYDESYNPVIVDLLNQTTQNGLYASTVLVEVTNEPYYYDGWYASISDDDVNGALEYMRLFNSTIKAIKDFNNTIQVGGPSGFRNAPVLTQTFLSNMSLMSYPADFHSIHPYGYNDVNGLEQYADIDAYLGNCTVFGVDCSHIVASEWSVGSTTLKNTTSNYDQFSASWGQSYTSLLNGYPSNVTSQIYQWFEQYSYINNSANYPEYSSKWHMVLDPQFSSDDAGELTAGYNITKDFGNCMRAGSMVENSTSDDGNIVTVAGNNSGSYCIVVINKDQVNSKNVTIDLISNSIENMSDYETGTFYPVVGGTLSLGVLNPNQVVFLNYTQSNGNSNPLFEGVADFSLDEDFSPLNLDLTLNVSDVEDATNLLTYNWTLNDSSVFSLDIVNTTGIATLTSLTNSFGSVLVSISVVDTGGLSNSTEFSLTVNHILPTQTEPSIDSSDSSTNNTFADLIVSNQSTSGHGIIYNSITWLLNNQTNISTIRPDDNGLVLFMPLDGNSTPEIMDYAGNNNGSFNGAIDYNSSCQIDGCYNFSGDTTTNSYINIPDSSVFTPSYYDGFSVSLWVNFDSLTAPDGNSQKIVSKGAVSEYEWEVRKSTGADGLGFNLFENDGTAHCTASSLGGSVPNNTWVQVVAVYNNDTNCSLYINGIQSGAVANAVGGTHVSDRSANVTIGVRGDGAGEFAGFVDNLAIYNKTLSDNEIFNQYEATKTAYTLNNSFTTEGDFGRAEITPWDFTSSGTPFNSTEMEIFCGQPTDGVQIGESITTCSGTYNLNGTVGANAISIVASNIIFDCNYSTIYGNWSRTDEELDYYGITINSGLQNITIQNCNLKNYRHAFRGQSNDNIIWINDSTDDVKNGLYITSVTNSFVLNSSFNNNSNYHIYNEMGNGDTFENNTFTNTFQSAINLVTYGENNTIRTNSFDEGGVLGTNYNYTNIEGNTWNARQVEGGYTIYLENGYYNNITANTIKDGTIQTNQIWIINETGYQFFNNIFSNNSQNDTTGSTSDLVIGNGANNGLVYNNTFWQNDIGMRMTSGFDTQFFNNYYNLSVTDRDGYGTGLMLDGRHDTTIDNISIYNETFENMGSNGIVIRKATNVLIDNISIDLLPISELPNYPVRNGGEARCGISVYEIYKTWTGDNNESSEDNITKIAIYNSTNITITNVTYGPNVECYIQAQGTNNLVEDLGSYWFVSHQVPTFLVDRTDFYLNLAFENMTSKNRTSDVSDLLSQGWMNPELVYYKLHQSYLYYLNPNDTNSIGLNTNNRTRALMFLSNGSTPCTDISSCSGDFNVTVGGLQACNVLDNYSVIENEVRVNDPISILAVSSFEKKITSTLTDAINTTVTINMTCDPEVVQDVVFTNSLGTHGRWVYADIASSCISNTLTLPGDMLIAPDDSNVITIETFTPQGPGSGGGTPPNPPSLSNETNKTCLPNQVWDEGLGICVAKSLSLNLGGIKEKVKNNLPLIIGISIAVIVIVVIVTRRRR